MVTTFISSVQFSSFAQLYPTLCDAMDCSIPGFPVHCNSQSLLKLMSKLVMPSNHLILCHPLLPHSVFPRIRKNGASLIAQFVKNPPAMQETPVRFLSWEDTLKGEKLPSLVFWPGELHGLYSPCGWKESDRTERLSLS